MTPGQHLLEKKNRLVLDDLY